VATAPQPFPNPSPATSAASPSPWRLARFDRGEIAGSLGDLGTFIPLLVGMVMTNGLDLVSGLFFAGFFNVLTGFTFAIPMAVQPMKAIAAVAIAEGLTPTQIVAAGMATSVVLLVLGLTRWIDTFNRILPVSVVRGLQLGLGLRLAEQGIQLIAGTGSWWGADSIGVGVTGLALVLLLASSARWPTALLVFGVGLVLAAVGHPDAMRALSIGLSFPHLVYPTLADFRVGFWRAALPQIPLTTLNSVIAVCALSVQLFPDRPASPRRVAISVAVMNLIGGWFGAMPMCHGAGGLAGQYRFGARTNGSILFLGAVKMLLAVLFGASLLTLLGVYPKSILGVLLAVSGIELALVCRDQTGREEVTIMLGTAAATLALGNVATGFVAGWLLALLVQAAERRSSRTRPAA
jgi:MFS superfamily sulfate permease-like transporter